MRRAVKPDPVPPIHDENETLAEFFRLALTSERVKDQKSLQTGALIGYLPNTIEHDIDDILAHGVMSTCIIIR